MKYTEGKRETATFPSLPRVSETTWGYVDFKGARLNLEGFWPGFSCQVEEGLFFVCKIFIGWKQLWCFLHITYIIYHSCLSFWGVLQKSSRWFPAKVSHVFCHFHDLMLLQNVGRCVASVCQIVLYRIWFWSSHKNTELWNYSRNHLPVFRGPGVQGNLVKLDSKNRMNSEKW